MSTKIVNKMIHDRIEHLRFVDDQPARFGLQNQSRTHGVHDALRKILLANTVLVTPALFPTISQAANASVSALDMHYSPDFFIHSSPIAQAGCTYLGDDCPLGVILFSGLVELLTTAELRFVIGHEIGHFLFGHHNFTLENTSQLTPSKRHAYLSWHRAAEISADRVGLVCAQSENDAVAAILKIASGLSTKHLRLDAFAYQQQAKKIIEAGNVYGSQDSHPSLPLRARAIHWFAMSESYSNWCNLGLADTLSNNEVDDIIRKDLSKSTTHGKNSQSSSSILSRAMLWSLLCFYIADGLLSTDEQKALVRHTNKRDATKAINFVRNYGTAATIEKHRDAIRKMHNISIEEREGFLANLSAILYDTSKDQDAVRKFLRDMGLMIESAAN